MDTCMFKDCVLSPGWDERMAQTRSDIADIKALLAQMTFLVHRIDRRLDELTGRAK